MPRNEQSQDVFRFGVFELDPRSGELRKSGAKPRLQEQPLQVLLILLERPGDVVTRDEFRCFIESGNSGFVVGERGFGPATALDTVDAPILKPSAFGRGWDLGACVNGGVEGRAGDAPLPPKWLITMGLRQKNRFNECKACGCEPASNHMSGFGFSATDSDSGRRAHGSHERARSARKGRKKHVSVLPRPNRSPWIVVEQNHNGIGKLMVPAFQIYANMNVINDL